MNGRLSASCYERALCPFQGRERESYELFWEDETLNLMHLWAKLYVFQIFKGCFEQEDYYVFKIFETVRGVREIQGREMLHIREGFVVRKEKENWKRRMLKNTHYIKWIYNFFYFLVETIL